MSSKIALGAAWVFLAAILVFRCFDEPIKKALSSIVVKCRKCGFPLTYTRKNIILIECDLTDWDNFGQRTGTVYLYWEEKRRCCIWCKHHQLLKRICRSDLTEKEVSPAKK
jgi:hypothetical protein